MAALQHVGAAAPGPVTPTSDEATRQGGFRGQGTSDNRDCAALDAVRKAIATMKAQAARAGCSLHELADGTFLIARWNLTRPCADLREVGEFLHRIEGRP